MKKIFAILMLAVVFSSCTEDVQRNSPAFEGLKDDVRWRSAGITATISTGNVITITGVRQYETLTLTFPAPNRVATKQSPVIYELGTSENKKATFVYDIESDILTYATGTGMGDGQIKIEDYVPGSTTGLRISGTFRFNAENVDDNPLGGEILNFQYGTIYQIPVYPTL